MSSSAPLDVQWTTPDPMPTTNNNKQQQQQINPRPEEFFGSRHVLALMSMSLLAVSYTMRVNLSVAIVAMVKSTKNVNDSTIEEEACPFPGDYDPDESPRPEGEFEWTGKTQGLILGAFFYGYCLTNILGGRAAEYWGGRIVAGLSITVMGLLTIITPPVSRYSTSLFIAIRVLEGCISGVTFPALNTLIASWYPTAERSKFSSIIFSGMYMGTVVGLIVSGWLCGSEFLGGWPSAFYVFGALGVVCGVLWMFIVRDNPMHHPRISDAELNYILKGCPDTKERPPVPWKSIFTSKYFWTIAAMHFADNWAFYMLLTELPTYLDQILHININNNGLFSALPYLGGWIFSIIYSLVCDKLIARGKISILFVRKMAMIIGDYSPTIGLIALCFVNCHAAGAVAIFVVSETFNGSTYSGYMCSHADISPRFAGTLMGLTNTIATIPGFITPMITGILTEDRQTLWAWRTLFLIAALINGIGVTIYITFITTDIQPWNGSESEIDTEVKCETKTQNKSDKKRF